ncbi:adenosylmethionine--8-amino-7-oxononanoate transaminase [Buchnera aphidicola]|uniref:adenosylmethionine--8-amino-7-oxononanoate transaminase n=1 Tax=Buchnera aphidicola TaxID=9 RepID=UPI0034649DD1
MKKNDLKFDLQHIWHPYDSMKKSVTRYFVSSAHGVYLKLNNNIKLIDAMSSWWSAIHGYNFQPLNNAAIQQINKMSHVMFGGLTHAPAIKLCKELIKILPKKLECIFLCDSGSVSIEVAMKMAIQYCNTINHTKKYFLTIRHGYHGDKFSSMSICDPIISMHSLYNTVLPKNLFAQQPELSFTDSWKNNDISSFMNLIIQYKSKIIAVILEPIVQGIGGMKFYHPEYLKKVRLLCNMYNIPLILDEIATGFGRTGKMFAFEHSNIVPDILCLGKALTGGMMTLAATVTTKKIADVISNHYPYKFMHGPTFMGNPLACSVASKNISILRTQKWKIQVRRIEEFFKKKLLPLINHPRIVQIRILGAIAVIEFYSFINVTLIQKFFVNHGVWIRPFQNILYLTPPYIIKTHHLKKIITTIKYAIQNNTLFL